MNTRSRVISVCLMLSIGVVASSSAMAQGMMGGTGQGMMGRSMMQSDSRRDMMGPGMMQSGGGGMNCPMMGAMMQGSQNMMGSGMMGPEMMRGGFGGMSTLFGSRVAPTMNLSVDDVRGYLTVQLDRLGNKRLKIGNINAEGGSITAEIVTADNSLVQRMKVDRSTGNIEYEN